MVPSLESSWVQGVEDFFGFSLLRVTSSMDLGFEIKVREPWNVGADRMVNVAGGIALYGVPLLLADFGTAFTLDVVDSEKNYLGGTIAPGIGVSVEALFGKTAKLPRVYMEAPPQAIGKDTIEAIQSGIIYGYAAMVDGLVRRIWKELGRKTPVVVTGGHGKILREHSETITDLSPWLTLEGLSLLYYRNRKEENCGCFE